MKKVIVGLVALMVMSSTAVLADNGKKKVKAKTCTNKCAENKNCKPSAKCQTTHCCG